MSTSLGGLGGLGESGESGRRAAIDGFETTNRESCRARARPRANLVGASDQRYNVRMPFFVAIVGLAVGLLLILLMARYSPKGSLERSPAESGRPAPPEITADEWQDLIGDLVRSIGLEVVFSSKGTGGVVEITARDPKPLAGGKFLVVATPVLGHGPIDAQEILSFADTVRGDQGILKGIYIALAGFNDEARMAMQTTAANIELIDARKLLELARDQMPARVSDLRKYGGFAQAV